jgi:hypothetical protein
MIIPLLYGQTYIFMGKMMAFLMASGSVSINENVSDRICGYLIHTDKSNGI